MLMRSAVLLCVVLGVGGCATNQVMTEVLSSWEGASLAQVKAQWGEPDSVVVLAGNQTEMTWRNDMPEYRETSRVSTTKYNIFKGASHETRSAGVMEVRKTCNRTLTFDANQRVVGSGRWDGSNCPPFRAVDYNEWRRAG